MRPCFLVIDNEYPGSISTRKLLLESEKFNVITAYSPLEAIQTLDRFPNVNGVVLDSQIQGKSCGEVVGQLRRKHANIPVVTVSPGGQDPCGGEQLHVSNYDPKQLLDALQRLCPGETQQLLKHEEDISPN